MASTRPEIVSRGEDHVVAVFDDVLVQLWTHGVPLDAVRRVNVAADRLAATGKVFSSIVVLPPTSKPPTDQARRLLISFAQRHARAMPSFVLVVEGTGLRGAISRSIMTGMSLLVPQIPVAIVKDIDGGMTLLRTHASVFDREALQAFIEGLRPSPPPPLPELRQNARARSTS